MTGPATSWAAARDFDVPVDVFTDLAGGTVNDHLVTLDTSTLGLKTGTLDLFVDDALVRSIALTATVVPEPCGVALVGAGVLALLARRRRR